MVVTPKQAGLTADTSVTTPERYVIQKVASSSRRLKIRERRPILPSYSFSQSRFGLPALTRVEARVVQEFEPNH